MTTESPPKLPLECNAPVAGPATLDTGCYLIRHYEPSLLGGTHHCDGVLRVVRDNITNTLRASGDLYLHNPLVAAEPEPKLSPFSNDPLPPIIPLWPGNTPTSGLQ